MKLPFVQSMALNAYTKMRCQQDFIKNIIYIYMCVCVCVTHLKYISIVNLNYEVV